MLTSGHSCKNDLVCCLCRWSSNLKARELFYNCQYKLGCILYDEEQEQKGKSCKKGQKG